MRLIPIANEGWRFIIPSLGLGLILIALQFGVGPSLFLKMASVICFLFAIACAGFFRDFDRNTPIDPSVIYSPGDGRVLEAGPASETPLGKGKIIRIFLSVLDGHIQRIPSAGTVQSIRYQKGLFLDARNPDAHIRNEQNAVHLTTANGPMVITQIAGLIARRIICWVKEGAILNQGDRYGLIRFGSQVDVFLPENVEIIINVGDRVIGGITPLARWQEKKHDI